MKTVQIEVLITILLCLCQKFLNVLSHSTKTSVSIDAEESIEYARSINISKNVSKILDQLLKGYDKRLRPNYAGPPVEVGITININNINSVSEVNMDYTMDIFFRQMWTDKRLSFDGVSELVIGSDMLHKIWVPDTYIANDRKTYFHKATVQNKFIRINPDGQVLYSMRMTVTAACPMDFRYFPMDHQECDLEIESYGFRMEDIKYKWAAGLNASAVDVAPNIELPQLKYKAYKLIERQFRLSTGLYSRLTMKLYFVRSLGYFITQIYIPSTLIVALSWVSFWLDRTAAPARVSLGITTVLTMVTFIWSTNASLPKISYIKGIDVYLVCCFFMTFASVIEYAMVSYVHHRTERRKRKAIQKFQLLQNSNQLQQIAILNNNNLNTSNLIRSGTNKALNRSKETINEKEFNHESNHHNRHHKPHSKSHVYHENNEHENEVSKHLKETNDDVTYVPIYKEKHKKCTCNIHQYSTRNFDTNSCELNPKTSKKSEKIPRSNFSEHSINDGNSIDFKTNTISNNKNYHQIKNKMDKKDSFSNKLPLGSNSIKGPAQSIFVPQLSKKKRCCSIKASTIDNYSRIVFPTTFLTFHIIYWTYYLKISS